MHDGRKLPQQGAGIAAADAEAAADEKEVPAAVICDDAASPRGRKNRAGLERGQGEIACEAEGPSTRQHETIPCLQADRVGNTLHGQPARAGNHDIAFDQPVLVRELDGPVAAGIEPSGHVAARFQQRQHI